VSSATGLSEAFRDLKVQRISHSEMLQVSVDVAAAAGSGRNPISSEAAPQTDEI
jgi:hypothetical protein